MKMISREKNSHYIVHSTVCRLSFHCIVQVPLVKTHLLCRVLVLRIHSGLKSGGKLQFGKVVLLRLASKAKFNIIFLPICQPIVHISVYYMIQVHIYKYCVIIIYVCIFAGGPKRDATWPLLPCPLPLKKHCKYY